MEDPTDRSPETFPGRTDRPAREARVHVQKLMTMGQLALGVAHEMSSPLQFMGDSIDFLGSAFEDIAAYLNGTVTAEEADLVYLQEQVPLAVDRARRGLLRVTEILRVMREFAHPGSHERTPVDLHQVIENVLIVARNEYKHAANVEKQFSAIPPAYCEIGAAQQVLLNLIVNAAHAIHDTKGEGNHGTIWIRTHHEPPFVVVEVEDEGGGIADDVKPHIFERFFTTKEAGRGTGQGLSLVRDLVLDNDGEVSFETELGKGTTITVRFPAEAPNDE